MEIERILNGKPVTFQLTDEELVDAYFEQQLIFDTEDVLSTIDDLSDEEVQEMFGVTISQFEELAPDIADVMRSNLDKYDMPFDEARLDAIESVIEVHSV